MQKVLVAAFGAYADAEAAVRDLEIAGIAGEQVEIISDVDRDERAEASGLEPREGIAERIARIWHGFRPTNKPEVHDYPGDMPDYIGEQEFYATHVRKEGAILIVRVPTEALASAAQEILSGHGSKQRNGSRGVMTGKSATNRAEPPPAFRNAFHIYYFHFRNYFLPYAGILPRPHVGNRGRR